MAIDSEKKEVGGWWMWILGLSVVTIVVLTGLSYVGVIGQTVVEREVFEQSYQKTAAEKAKIATFEAQLAEIDRKLRNSSIDQNLRADLEAQAASIRIQLAAAKGTK